MLTLTREVENYAVKAKAIYRTNPLLGRTLSPPQASSLSPLVLTSRMSPHPVGSEPFPERVRKGGEPPCSAHHLCFPITPSQPLAAWFPAPPFLCLQLVRLALPATWQCLSCPRPPGVELALPPSEIGQW